MSSASAHQEAEEPLTKTKLFTLGDDGAWTDMGVGIASVADDNDNGLPIMRLDIVTIPLPDEVEEVLLSTPVSPDDIYTVQKGSILVWCDPELGRDMAASFHSKEGCSFIVDKIKGYQLNLRRRKEEAQRQQQQQQQQQGGGGVGLTRTNSGYYNNNSNNNTNGSSGSTLLDDASSDPLAYSSPWTVCRTNLPAISSALRDNRMRIGSHIRDYREFVYEVCTLFTQFAAVLFAAASASTSSSRSNNNESNVSRSDAVSNMPKEEGMSDDTSVVATASSSSSLTAGDSVAAPPTPEAVADAKRAVDYICDIIMTILTQHSADVKILSQIVEDRNIETIVDIVQFAIGKRDKASGFVTKAERHAMFKDPAHLPPTIVNKIHNFFAVQYLRDLVPQVLEEGDPGGSLPLVSLLLVRARHTMLTELMNSDILRNALRCGQSVEHSRGMMGMMLDITTYVKNTSAVSSETKNEVYAKAIELGLLEFIEDLFAKELALADPALMSAPAMLQAADCLSHLAMWAPVQCFSWLLRDAAEKREGPRLDPLSTLHKARHAAIEAFLAKGMSAAGPRSLNRSLTPSCASGGAAAVVAAPATPSGPPPPTTSTPPPSQSGVVSHGAEDDFAIGGDVPPPITITACAGPEDDAAASLAGASGANATENKLGGGGDAGVGADASASSLPSTFVPASQSSDISADGGTPVTPTATATPTTAENSSAAVVKGDEKRMGQGGSEGGDDTAKAQEGEEDRQQQQPIYGTNNDFSGCSLLHLLFEALVVVRDAVAAQAIGDVIYNLGVGTLQPNAVMTMFGVEAVGLRLRILQYWCCGPTVMAGCPAPLGGALHCGTAIANTCHRNGFMAEDDTAEEGGARHQQQQQHTAVATVPLFVAMIASAQMSRWAPANATAAAATSAVSALTATPQRPSPLLLTGEKRPRGGDDGEPLSAPLALEGEAMMANHSNSTDDDTYTNAKADGNTNDSDDLSAEMSPSVASPRWQQQQQQRRRRQQREASMEHDADEAAVNTLPTSSFTRHLRDLNKCPLARRRGAGAGGEGGIPRRGLRMSSSGEAEVIELQCLRVLRLLARERTVSCSAQFADLLRTSDLLGRIATALHPRSLISNKLCCVAAEFLSEVIKTNASRLLQLVIDSHVMDALVRLHETLPRRSSVLSSSILATFNAIANSVAEARQRFVNSGGGSGGGGGFGGYGGVGGLYSSFGGGGGGLNPYLSRLAATGGPDSFFSAPDAPPPPPDLSLVDHVLLHHSSYIGYFAPALLKKLTRVKETNGRDVAEEGSSAVGSFSEARPMSDTEFQAILVEYGYGGEGSTAVAASMDTGVVLSTVPGYDTDRTVPTAEEEDEGEGEEREGDEEGRGRGVASASVSYRYASDDASSRSGSSSNSNGSDASYDDDFSANTSNASGSDPNTNTNNNANDSEHQSRALLPPAGAGEDAGLGAQGSVESDDGVAAALLGDVHPHVQVADLPEVSAAPSCSEGEEERLGAASDNGLRTPVETPVITTDADATTTDACGGVAALYDEKTADTSAGAEAHTNDNTDANDNGADATSPCTLPPPNADASLGDSTVPEASTAELSEASSGGDNTSHVQTAPPEAANATAEVETEAEAAATTSSSSAQVSLGGASVSEASTAPTAPSTPDSCGALSSGIGSAAAGFAVDPTAPTIHVRAEGDQPQQDDNAAPLAASLRSVAVAAENFGEESDTPSAVAVAVAVAAPAAAEGAVTAVAETEAEHGARSHQPQSSAAVDDANTVQPISSSNTCSASTAPATPLNSAEAEAASSSVCSEGTPDAAMATHPSTPSCANSLAIEASEPKEEEEMREAGEEPLAKRAPRAEGTEGTASK